VREGGSRRDSYLVVPDDPVASIQGVTATPRIMPGLRYFYSHTHTHTHRERERESISTKIRRRQYTQQNETLQ